MSDDWKEVASLGTGRKLLPDKNPDALLEKFSANLAQDELRLLAGAGLKALQKMAAYMPALDKNLSPQADELRPSKPYKESHILHLLRLYDAYFPKVYLEWLHWASLSKAYLPHETIPILLDLASDFPESQALTKHFVGGRGRWLARHRDSDKWAWLPQVEVGRIPRIGKEKKQEERAIALFKPYHFYHLGGNVRDALRQLNHPWSLRFSEMLLETIKGVIAQNALRNSVDQIDIIRLAQYRLHPALAEDFYQQFHSNSRDPELLKVLENMGRLIEFRMDIRESFGIVD